MTEAEKLAARMRIFADLGLDAVTGMCKTITFPTLRNIQAANDSASREILSEHELAVCSKEGISPVLFSPLARLSQQNVTRWQSCASLWQRMAVLLRQSNPTKP